MPKLNELSNKQIDFHIKKIKGSLNQGDLSNNNTIRLQSLIKEKKKRKTNFVKAKINTRPNKISKKIKKTKLVRAPIGKIRNPWLVMLFSLITLGIYCLYYIYKTTNEIHQVRRTGITGILMLLMSFTPIGILTVFLLPHYINLMYEENAKSCNIKWYYGIIAFVPLIGGLILMYMMQKELNSFWEQQRLDQPQ